MPIIGEPFILKSVSIYWLELKVSLELKYGIGSLGNILCQLPIKCLSNLCWYFGGVLSKNHKCIFASSYLCPSFICYVPIPCCLYWSCSVIFIYSLFIENINLPYIIFPIFDFHLSFLFPYISLGVPLHGTVPEVRHWSFFSSWYTPQVAISIQNVVLPV